MKSTRALRSSMGTFREFSTEKKTENTEETEYKGWFLIQDEESKELFHWNSETDEYRIPSAETSVWKRVLDDSGAYFYFNQETKEVTDFFARHPENEDWDWEGTYIYCVYWLYL